MGEDNFKTTKGYGKERLQRLSFAKDAKSVIIKGSTPSMKSQSGDFCQIRQFKVLNRCCLHFALTLP
jgi:hypothetical protein